MNFKQMVLNAEHKDDTQIHILGLKVGRVYHIRPIIRYNHTTGIFRPTLTTGNYLITAIDYLHGFDRSTHFQVEGNPMWHSFDDDKFVFSYCPMQYELNLKSYTSNPDLQDFCWADTKEKAAAEFLRRNEYQLQDYDVSMIIEHIESV